jgi:hypothetical protein
MDKLALLGVGRASHQAAVLENAHAWTEIEFDDEEAETRRDFIDFWENRIARLNEVHAELLAKSEHLLEVERLSSQPLHAHRLRLRSLFLVPLLTAYA